MSWECLEEKEKLIVTAVAFCDSILCSRMTLILAEETWRTTRTYGERKNIQKLSGNSLKRTFHACMFNSRLFSA